MNPKDALRKLSSNPWLRATGYAVVSLIIVAVPNINASLSPWARIAVISAGAIAALFIGASEYRNQSNHSRLIFDWDKLVSKILAGRVALAQLFFNDLFFRDHTIDSQLETPPESRHISISIYRYSANTLVPIYTNESKKNPVRLSIYEGLPGVIQAGLFHEPSRWGSSPSKRNTVVFRWGRKLNDPSVLNPQKDVNSSAPNLAQNGKRFVLATAFKYRGFQGVLVVASNRLPDALIENGRELEMDEVSGNPEREAALWLKRCARRMRLMAQACRQMMRLSQSAANGTPDTFNLGENYRSDVVTHLGALTFEELGYKEAECDAEGTHTIQVRLEAHAASVPSERTLPGSSNIVHLEDPQRHHEDDQLGARDANPSDKRRAAGHERMAGLDDPAQGGKDR